MVESTRWGGIGCQLQGQAPDKKPRRVASLLSASEISLLTLPLFLIDFRVRSRVYSSPMTKPNLKIGELAKRSCVSQDTLRFYEKRGLLQPSSRSPAGYRLYDSHDVKRVGFIMSAKGVGFTLNEIRDLLALEVTKDEKSCEDVKRIVDEKLVTVEKRINEMGRIKTSLEALGKACCGGDEPATHCTILETLNAEGDLGLIPG